MALIDELGRFFELDGAQLVVLVSLALSCALLGTWLVLRKMAMLANSISHTVLLGIVAAWILHPWIGQGPSPNMALLMLCAGAVSALTSLSTHFFHHVLKLQEDASIGLVFSGLFALGIFSLSWAFPHSHIGIEVIMGNADAIGWEDFSSCSFVLGLNALVLWLLHKEYRLSTFDRQLASSMGFYPALLDFILMSQLTLTIMVGFRAVGSFLVLAFLVGPVLGARVLSKSLGAMLLIASSIGGLCAIGACVAARILLNTSGVAISTAGLAVTFLLVAFLSIAGFYSLRRSLYRRHYRRWKVE